MGDLAAGSDYRVSCAEDLPVPAYFAKLEEMRKREYLGSIELLVLLAVMRAGRNAYGIPIAREIEASSGREVALGSIYATLSRLEAKGLIVSELGDPTPERGGRAKAFFRLTAKGLRETRDAQAMLTRMWSGLPELERGGAAQEIG
jgi:DNA-binding PadR family transcriptional regulator